MENGKVFRGSVFGGFNKQDVMNYVEQLQNEMASVKQQLKELENQLDAQSAELERIPELESQLERMQQVEQQNTELMTEVERLSRDSQKAQDEYEKVKSAEAQLGAAFVDARRYSDEIITAAKDRAADVSKQASDDIALKAEQIRRVASDAERITAEMRAKMESVSRSISDLSAKMSSVAVTLVKTEAPVEFKPRVNFDALKEIVGLFY